MIDEFKRYLKRDRKHVKTISSYVRVIQEFEIWYKDIYNCDFCCLNKQDIVEFKHYLEDCKKNKPSTIRYKLAVLSKLNEFLIHKKVFIIKRVVTWKIS